MQMPAETHQKQKTSIDLTTPMLASNASMEAPEMILEQISCIQYPIKFRQEKKNVWTLINFDSKVNIITPAYAAVLGLKICSTCLWAQKIGGFLLKIFGMIIASFQVKEKLG